MPSFLYSDTEIESDGGGPRFKTNNSAQHAKWEKADILEMTVEYLHQMRSSQACLSSPSTSSNPTPPQIPTPPEEKPIQMTPLIPTFMNPVMQQYMAFQQLAQLSMYSQIMNNPIGYRENDSSSKVESINSKQEEKSI
ncbi:hypothetical protein GCK72_014326 [Caenorhabditis remanei]|uniref:BHLH domain-containing protein n=1 Tax=Caenorhabditis remanei TaxID=31234 RepID=A0A6A5GTN4_CAERE|nr:hypothetical protein GCK72_014326 [Caenorhabditis remanei]KAF1757869.1 hypothetical protein GCK72_014326 [Caenorhabditis remanei]